MPSKGNVTIGAGSYIKEDVNITGGKDEPSIIGKNCTLRGSCYIYGSVLEDGTIVESSILVKKKSQDEKKSRWINKSRKVCLAMS